MLLLLLPLANAQAQKSKKTTLSDREYWVSLAVKMATPVLENMSRGELQKTMQTEFSPNFDNRNRKVVYMEILEIGEFISVKGNVSFCNV